MKTEEKEVTHRLIKHAQKGETFCGIYYLENLMVKIAKNGNKYSDLTVRDKSGSSFVRFWGEVTDAKKGDYIDIAANVEEYQGNTQIVARRVTKEETPDDLSNYIAIAETADEDIKWFDSFRAEISNLGESSGDRTCEYVNNDLFHSGKFLEKFTSAPGSISPYYGKKGGLLERVGKIAQITKSMAQPYGLAETEKAILFTASLLHRVGAVDAYDFIDCMPVETKQGILVGVDALTIIRISRSVRKVLKNASKNDITVDSDTILRLLHIFALPSHDKPATKEALVFSEACEADLKIVEAINFIEQDENIGEDFTAYDPILRRRYYKG